MKQDNVILMLKYNEMEKYITILDFVKNEVHILQFTEKETFVEEFLLINNFDSSNCQWMIQNKLKLQIH